MGNVICEKCKLEADTKCPFCRNVFPEKESPMPFLQYEAKSKTTKDWEGKEFTVWEMRIVLPYMSTGSLHDALKYLESGFRVIKEHPELYQSLEQVGCDHEFTFKEGAHSTIGCGHCHKECRKNPY